MLTFQNMQNSKTWECIFWFYTYEGRCVDWKLSRRWIHKPSSSLSTSRVYHHLSDSNYRSSQHMDWLEPGMSLPATRLIIALAPFLQQFRQIEESTFSNHLTNNCYGFARVSVDTLCTYGMKNVRLFLKTYISNFYCRALMFWVFCRV